MKLGRMRTTVDLPDAMLEKARALAASRSMSLKHLMAEALEEHLRRCEDTPAVRGREPPWMAGFGELADLADENRRILSLIEEEFESVDPDDTE